MPYSGPGDRTLPEHVKKMPVGKRRQWVEVFNSVMERMHDEGAAMRQANGVTKEASETFAVLRAALKEAGKTEEEIEAAVKDFAEKCGMEYGPAISVIEYHPFGGATSFDDLDAYMESQHLAMHTNETTMQFSAIVENIMQSDLDMAGKATAIKQAADDLAERVDNPPEMMKEEGGLKGWLSRTFGKAVDPDIGGGIDRSKIPARDFAGRNRSFPIVSPKDVSDAARSIGRAGSDNYDSATLKRNITRIAKRKGPQFVAALPASWREDNKEDGGSFTVYKDADGHWRWLAVYSNNFYDRDGEVFTEAAHKEYIGWTEQTGRYPDLWLWHTPGSKCGKADLLDYSDGLAIASGVFQKDCEDVAEALASEKSLGVSHGYRFESEHLDNDGSYNRYRTFEISPLPLERAANEGTLFLSEKEDIAMPLTKEKREFLASKLGEERVKRIETGLDSLSKDLKESGVAWKDVAEALNDAPPAVATADPTSTTVQAAASTAGGDQEKKPEATAPTFSVEDVKAAVTAAIGAAIAPFEERMKALEEKDNSWLPRFYGARPTEANKAVDGRTSLGQEAADAQKAADEADAGKTANGDNWYLQALGRSMVAGGINT